MLAWCRGRTPARLAAVSAAEAGACEAKAITFTDADGTSATLKLTSGTAAVQFAGDNLYQLVGKSDVKMTGTNIRISNIDLTGDTSKATLSFTLKNSIAGSDGQIDLGGITSQGAVKSIAGKGVNLSGDIILGGAVQSLTLNDVLGSQRALSWGGSPQDPGAALVFHNVTDVTLTSGTPIKSLAVGYWHDDSGDADLITAPSLAKLSCVDGFEAGLYLSGDGVTAGKTVLGAVSVKGRLTGGAWIVLGSAGAISAAGTDTDWSAVIDGAVKSITTKGSTAGTIEALSIGSFKVTGDLDGATIHLTQPSSSDLPKLKALGSLSVSGTMNSSILASQGNIGTVSLGRMIGSTIFAGVDTLRNAPGTLPDETADFDAMCALDKLTVAGITGQAVSFQDSFVAATKLGAITLLDLPTDGTAGGGLAGDSLLKTYVRKAGKLAAFTLKGPLDAATPVEQIDDYIARLV